MLDVTGAFTRPRIVHDDGTEAFISNGEALDRALASLGLELPPEPRRPRLWKAMGWGVTLTLLSAGLWQSVHFMIWALDLWAPGRLPQ
jgi:hypothetical protein